MKAVLFTRYGSTEGLQFADDIERPAPGDNEVLIKVHAASVNSWDWELMRAKPFVNRMMFGLVRPKKIKSLGCDVAGRITQMGNKVNHFKVGDEVFGDLSSGHWGGFAEYTCATENELAIKPASLTFEQAAAIPQAGLLALQGLCNKTEIQPQHQILINGAGGGVGSFAIQIAKSYGAHVTAVDSSDKLALMRSLGADQVIDFTEENFTQNKQQYDLILDVAAHHSLRSYLRVLKPKGKYVMVGGATKTVNQLLLLGPLFSLFTGKKLSLLMHKANQKLDVLTLLITQGKVSPVIDRSYPLNETAAAIRYVEQGHAKGKVIVTMDKD